MLSYIFVFSLGAFVGVMILSIIAVVVSGDWSQDD